ADGQARQVLELFAKVRNFSLAEGGTNPVQARDQIVNQLRDWYDQVFEQVAPIIAFGLHHGGTQLEKLQKQQTESLERINQTSSAYMKELEETAKKASEALKD